MTALSRYFHGRVEPMRGVLLARATLAVVAFDCWTQHLPRAARYGDGAFNVAHFAWLDLVQPPPTAPLYMSVMALAGLLALVAALTEGALWLRVNALALYTYGWSMSLLDGYQHHYFLSLLMFCLLFFPWTVGPSVDVDARGRSAKSGFGYVLACDLMAVVYAFAALAKTEGLFHGASGIERMIAAREQTALVQAMLGAGLSIASLGRLVGWGTLLLEVVLAIAYGMARVRDEPRRRAQITGAAGLAAALCLHGGVEVIGLNVAWFSAYMLLFAVAAFAPKAVIGRVARGFERGIAWLRADGAGEATIASLMLLSAAIFAVTLLWLGLPGARETAALGAAGIAASYLGAAVVERKRELARGIGALLVGVVAFSAAMVAADTRADYERQAGADRALRAEHRVRPSQPVRSPR